MALTAIFISQFKALIRQLICKFTEISLIKLYLEIKKEKFVREISNFPLVF